MTFSVFRRGRWATSFEAFLALPAGADGRALAMRARLIAAAALPAALATCHR
jgi:hypothetical protein